MKNKSKKQIVLIMTFSFILPAIIMAFAFYNTQIYPGGTNTVLIYDMHAQFLPIYASLRYLGNSDNSLFFTFFGALGNNALPNYSTYLVNPLSWVTVLFPLSKLPDVLYFLTILRIGLCGLGFSIYLLFGRREYREKRYPVAIIILSCCYALMSFNIVYSMCLNWLDITFLLPLVLTSLEQLMEGKRGISFVLLYTYAIYNSFQLSYIMGIFLILYLAFRLIDKQGMWKSVVPRFAIRVLLALGMSMPIFIPMMKAAGGRFGVEHEVAEGMAYYGIRDILPQFLSCRYSDINTGGLPYVFCGTATIILALIYLIRVAEERRKKLCALLIILFYLVSFCLVPLNKMWHGFSETLSFPGRYAYTLSCFLLILAYEAIPIIEKLVRLPRNIMPFIGGIALCIILSEQYMNASYILASANLKHRYKLSMVYDNYVAQLSDTLKQISDDGFYRINRGSSGFTYDDGMLLGYNGLAYFSSFYESAFMDFMGLMGFSQNAHVLEDIGVTPVMESILGVKYGIVIKDTGTLGDEVLYENAPFALTFNKHTLPLGFVMGNSRDISEGKMEYTSPVDDGNAFAYHELMLSDIYGDRCDIYEPIAYEIREMEDEESARHVSIDFVAKDNRPIWMFCKNATKEQLEATMKQSDNEQGLEDIDTDSEVTVNGKSILRVRSRYCTTCTYVGTFEAGEKVHIDAKDEYYFGEPWIVHFDKEKCDQILDNIRVNSGMNISYHHSGVVRGDITTPTDDSYVMFSLPYMKGYRVKIDGEPSEYRAYRGALMLVNIPEQGKHTIEVSFIPPGVVIGIMIGVISFAVFFALMMLEGFKDVPNETNLTAE